MYSLNYNHLLHKINVINENMKELNEKSYYEEELDSRIHIWSLDNHREPNHIVLHPNTWQYIGIQLGLLGHHDWTVDNKYKGLKLFRSFDVDEDKFEIG